MTMPRCVSAGPLFPSGRFRQSFSYLAQALHFFGFNAWSGIVYRGLNAARHQLVAQICSLEADMLRLQDPASSAKARPVSAKARSIE